MNFITSERGEDSLSIKSFPVHIFIKLYTLVVGEWNRPWGDVGQSLEGKQESYYRRHTRYLSSDLGFRLTMVQDMMS